MKNSKVDEIVYRELSGQDLRDNKVALIELIISVLKASFDGIENIKEHSEKIYENMISYQKNNSAILFGALINDSIIAFIWAHEKEILGEKLIHVSYLSVKSHYSSQGIGTKLFDLIEKTAIEKKVSKIEFMASIENESTMSFHKKNGYETNRVLFEKELTK